jgi:hypothetical protein
MAALSGASYTKLAAYKEADGWIFPWVFVRRQRFQLRLPSLPHARGPEGRRDRVQTTGGTLVGVGKVTMRLPKNAGRESGIVSSWGAATRPTAPPPTGDHDRGLHRLLGADALEHRMRGDASELAHALDRLVATLAHHPRAAAHGRRVSSSCNQTLGIVDRICFERGQTARLLCERSASYPGNSELVPVRRRAGSTRSGSDTPRSDEFGPFPVPCGGRFEADRCALAIIAFQQEGARRPADPTFDLQFFEWL